MKNPHRIIIAILLLIGSSISTDIFAQVKKEANPPRALFQSANYLHPVEGSYVELILSFDALSLEYAILSILKPSISEAKNVFIVDILLYTP